VVTLILLVLGFGTLIAIVCASRSPDWLRSMGRAEVDRHALRRARELDQLRFEIKRDARRLRRELLEEFRDREAT
jgi:hypothetical protein